MRLGPEKNTTTTVVLVGKLAAQDRVLYVPPQRQALLDILEECNFALSCHKLVLLQSIYSVCNISGTEIDHSCLVQIGSNFD